MSAHEGNKVPPITLAFWVIKIGATTLGETGGDFLSMSLNLGYAASTLILVGCFAVTLAGQLATRRYHPVAYWAVIVATTMVGTTMSDYMDRTLHLGYIAGSAILIAILLLILAVWRLTTGSVSASRIADRRSEAFYWTAILFSNTLGTAFGDFVSTTEGLGFAAGAFLIGGGLGLLAAAYAFTPLSRTALFWLAFILSRPLGATLGDLLTKPLSEGGFAMSRLDSSLVIAAFIVFAVWLVYGRRTARIVR